MNHKASDLTPPQEVIDKSGVIDLSERRRQRANTTIEREADPEYPNRNFWLIKSATRDGVQEAINGLIAEVESFGNGYGNFLGPRRSQAGCFFAIGETVIRTDKWEDLR